MSCSGSSSSCSEGPTPRRAFSSCLSGWTESSDARPRMPPRPSSAASPLYPMACSEPRPTGRSVPRPPATQGPLIPVSPPAAGRQDFLACPAPSREPAPVSRWVLLLAGWASLAASSAARADVIKVACGGEHSTNSVHVDDADESPPRLQALLGPGYQVMNFGFPRATVQTENLTFPNAMPFVQ